MATTKAAKKAATKTSKSASKAAGESTAKSANKSPNKSTAKSAAKSAGKSASRSAKQFKVGDQVAWNSSGGASTGRVVKVATANGKIKDFAFKASPDDPRYIVETDEGKHAAHKAGELKKT